LRGDVGGASPVDGTSSGAAGAGMEDKVPQRPTARRHVPHDRLEDIRLQTAHSDGVDGGAEGRFIMLGLSFTLRVPVVCHCFRENDAVIRIISARKANKRERSEYWS